MEPIMYECGLSVFNKVIGYDVKNKDYVYVLDNAAELSADQAFAQLIELLKLQQIKIKERCQHYVIAENNDTYTFANERTYKNGTAIIKPCNILRHVFSRDFSIESLYVDENGQVVDLTNQALNDISNRSLNISNGADRKTLFQRGNEFLVDCLYYNIKNNMHFVGGVEEFIYNFAPTSITKIDGANIKLQEIIGDQCKQFLSLINNISNLHRYFYNVCGMKLTPTFGHIIKEEKPIPFLQGNPSRMPMGSAGTVRVPASKWFTTDGEVQPPTPIENTDHINVGSRPLQEEEQEVIPSTAASISETVERINILQDRINSANIYSPGDAAMMRALNVRFNDLIAIRPSNPETRIKATKPFYGSSNAQRYKSMPKFR